MENIRIGIAYPAFIECFEDLFQEEILDLSKIKLGREMEEILNEIKLIIFSGGEDINPRIYGQTPTYSSGINSQRDEIEVNILGESKYYSEIKILGICRGHQLLNAHFGGEICQDIFLSGRKAHGNRHELTWKNTYGKLAKIFPTVNSLHHQGVLYPGQNFIPLAKYNDIIEATFHKNKYLSVQWHPEFFDIETMVKFKNLINLWVDNKIALINMVETKEPINAIFTDNTTDGYGKYIRNSANNYTESSS